MVFNSLRQSNCSGLGLGLETCGLGLGLGLPTFGLGLGLANTGLGLERTGLGLGLGLATAGLDYKTASSVSSTRYMDEMGGISPRLSFHSRTYIVDTHLSKT